MIWKSVDIKNAKNLLSDIKNQCIKSEEFINKEFSFENCEIPIINVTSKIFKYYPSSEAREEFLDKSFLDYEIYNSLI